MAQFDLTEYTGVPTQRVVGWMIRDGFEITIVANVQRTNGSDAPIAP